MEMDRYSLVQELMWVHEIGGNKDISTRSSSTSTRTRIPGETDSSGRKMPRKSRRCSNEAQKDAGNHVGKKTIHFIILIGKGFCQGLLRLTITPVWLGNFSTPSVDHWWPEWPGQEMDAVWNYNTIVDRSSDGRWIQNAMVFEVEVILKKPWNYCFFPRIQYRWRPSPECTVHN